MNTGDDEDIFESFDIEDLNAADEAHMTVLAKGKPTNWTWTFAGPGHPKTVAQSHRIARERLHEEREKEQARVNGKKWKAPAESVEATRKKNVDFIIERLVGWSPTTMRGEPYPFSVENARKLLLDPRKSGLLIQALEFLGEEQSFTQSSETTSSPSPSETSS